VNEGELAALLRQHASRHSVPGAAIGILREGATTTAYYGVADATSDEPITAKTRFSVGSLTKSMVATVIARLADEGRLSLDDPVVAHVPELRGSGWAESATLRDLLANRSGLPLRAGLEFGFAGHEDEDDSALARLAADIAAAVPTSSFWSYTNVGWCLLGRVIETATHCLGGRNAARPRRRYARDDLRHRPPWESARGGAHRHRGRAGAGRAVDRTRVWTGRYERRLDRRRSSSLSRLAPRRLGARRPACRARGDRDLRLARFLVSRLGMVRLGRRSGVGVGRVVPGERSVLQLVPEHQAAVVLMTNSNTGRAMYRSLFPDLMQSLFGIGVPPLRLDT
jgi:CubicO group peptidase (beta-lactamase class C family)